MNKILLYILFLFSFAFSEYKIVASDGDENDAFSNSISMDDEWIAISANKDEPNGEASGSVYLYKIESNEIINIVKIFPEDGAYNDYFGKSISLHNEWLAVSSVYDDVNGNKSGSVYIFYFNGNEWIEHTKIFPADGSPYDRFGYALDLHENVLVVGSIFDDDFGSNSGSVYAYELIDNQWLFQDKIYASLNAENNNFGIALSIYSNTLAVSSINADIDYLDQGLVDIFILNDSQWVYQESLVANNPSNYDHFGQSIDMYNNILGIGSCYDDDLNVNSGSVYIYELVDNSWTYKNKLLPFDGYANDNFGLSISIYENWISIGSRDDDNGINSGSVYIYGLDDNIFVHKDKITASDGTEYDEFSSALYLYENNLVVGSKYDDAMGNDSGSAYFFNFKGCTNENACNYSTYLISDESECFYPENGFDCDGECSTYIDECLVCGGGGANGDVNLDNQINIIDITIIINFILNNVEINDCIADLNQNTIINITDLVILIENILYNEN